MTAHSALAIPAPLQVAVVTLGCARNEVDSEELAGRLEAGGFVLVADPEDADTVVVNTCGFVEAAKKDSVDTLLEAADLKAADTVDAPRPSSRSAAWPSATARTSPSRCPRPTRCSGSTTTPTSRHGCARSWRGRPTRPTRRPTVVACSRSPRSSATPPRSPSPATTCQQADLTDIGVGAPATGPRAVRRRLDAGPMAPLKLASGCDRRCSFCAIPSFRGSFVSRRPSDVVGRGPVAGHAGRQASCSWSARTPRPTARTSATCACSRPCSPSSAASTGSSGSGCPTSSPPRRGRA